MSLDQAIDKIYGIELYNRAKNAVEKDHADAATVLKMVKRSIFGTILFHVALSIITLGILPIIYFFGTRWANKYNNPKPAPTNFFTAPWYIQQEAISDLKELVNTAAPDASEEADQNSSQNPEEHQDSQVEDSSSEAETPHEYDEERLYRFAKECHHPLGPRLGGRILVEDPLHKDLEREYADRMSATILDNGNVLACDLNTYKHGGEDRAIGIFDHSKKLLKPLFRYMQSQIENNLRALEYEPNKFAFFYIRNGKISVCYNDGQVDKTINEYTSTNIFIPLHFEITDTGFNTNLIYVDKCPISGGKNCIISLAPGQRSIHLFSHLQYKDDPTDITAITYHPSTAFLYVANSNNKLSRVPVKQNDIIKMIDRNGDAQTAELEKGELIKKIAVNHDGRYILVLREDATYEVYLSDGDFKTRLLVTAVIDPAVHGETLDIKFLNDDIIFATTQRVVRVPIALLKPAETLHNTHEEKDKKKSLTKEENAALRKHHTASQSKDKTFKAAQKLERLRSTILSNGDIVACDKAVFEGNTESYCLRVLHSQYALSVDKPIINDMQKGRMLYTPDPTAAEFIPFHQNDRLVFFVRDEDMILMLNADGHTIGAIIVPIKDSQLLIPIDYQILTDPQTASIIEISKDQILIHSMTVGVHGIVQNAIVLRQLWNPVMAATYTESNKRLYYVEGEQFKFITFDNIHSPNECGSTLSLQNVTKIAVSENGLRLATAKADGTITLYDMEEFNTNKSGDIKYLSEIKIEGAEPLDIRFVEDDKDLLITTNSHAVRINNFEEEFGKTASYNLKA